MPRQNRSTRDVKVFVSSPSGLEVERAVLVEEVGALSDEEESRNNPGLSVIQWPDDIGSGAGDYGQSVINRQTADYDIFACIVGTRMGTPTPRAASGTEEEFDRAIEAALQGGPLEVLLFFSNVPVHPQAIDLGQLTLVRAFREKVARLGVLYHTFSSREELRHFCKVSLREAYDRVRAASDPRQYRSTINSGAPAPVSKGIGLGDITLRHRITAPQWADAFLIPLAEYRRQNIRLTGRIEVLSPYFRFGFKYYDSREPLFSAGSVQTVGQNILVHVGRNSADLAWFVTSYRASYRLGPDEQLAEPADKAVANFALDITAAGNVALSLEGRLIYEGFFLIDGFPHLALLAWGDEHSFVCDVKDLVLHVPQHQVAS